MNFDLREVYKTYENLKEKHDFKEYEDEIDKNDKVLNKIPFDMQKAQQRISKLTGKYRMELNLLAYIYGNNMSSCDFANNPDSSEVSLCIFPSNGSPSSSSCSIPTYRPGVKM